MTEAMRLFIVRHGETAWNREGRFQGQLDVPLNEAGMLQADRVAERFRGYPLAAVLASPLSRARVTGERIFDAADCDAFVVDDGLGSRARAGSAEPEAVLPEVPDGAEGF